MCSRRFRLSQAARLNLFFRSARVKKSFFKFHPRHDSCRTLNDSGTHTGLSAHVSALPDTSGAFDFSSQEYWIENEDPRLLFRVHQRSGEKQPGRPPRAPVLSIGDQSKHEGVQAETRLLVWPRQRNHSADALMRPAPSHPS